MFNKLLILLSFAILLSASCKKARKLPVLVDDLPDSTIVVPDSSNTKPDTIVHVPDTIKPVPVIKNGTITSVEYVDSLLFITKNDFQINASDSASFSSDDPSITITPEGLVKRLTSGEVVVIKVKWIRNGKTSKVYAVGATDNQHVNPFVKFHAAISDDPVGQYMKGWKTLQKLPIIGESYAIVLRHADADNGKDYNLTHPNVEGPANWWKSPDSTIARQLNVQGITRATDLGVVFKDLQYPIARVVSSEFFRAVRTAQLINAGPTITIDGRINHPDYIKSGETLFKGLQHILKDAPVDGQMTLISTHHPINEFEREKVPVASFPKVSVFNWTGAYFVKISSDKTLSYEGAVSYGMFKFWCDLKLKRI